MKQLRRLSVRALLLSRALLMLGALGATAGCAPDTVSVRSTPRFKPEAIQSVVVMPFMRLDTPQRVFQGSPASPFENKAFFEYNRSVASSAPPLPERIDSKTATVPSWAPDKIGQMVYAKLNMLPGLRVVAPEQVVTAGVPQPFVGEMDSMMIRRIAQGFDADAVLIGFVRTFREREGSKIGGIPAAVGFDVRLLDASTGEVVWSGEYYEEQKPLTEDIRGFFERGGTFVSALELAQSGVDRLMERFPVGRTPMAQLERTK